MSDNNNDNKLTHEEAFIKALIARLDKLRAWVDEIRDKLKKKGHKLP